MATQRRDLWYKNAIIYCLDVETFMDGNDDGIGDFRGLISRLDQIAGMGITCIWLMPFYPTPNRDNGYDVKDYYNVDPRLGNLGDFVEFMVQASQHGIRVIIDLVVNHTSIEHPWFQAARKDPDSPYRDYYYWSEDKPEDAHEGVVFPGVQDTTWTYDEEANAYYFHRFYEHQPDLNIANPAVRDEIRKVMGFWLQLGVSGFRVDAAPFLINLPEAAELPDESNPHKSAKNGHDPYEYLKDFREFLSWRRGDAIILAEANISMDKVPEYFGDGDKLQLLFHFMLNQHLFLALATESAEPIKKGLNMPPEIPDTGQWAIFLRNHDELDLGRLSDKDRQTVFEKFAPDEDMRIYDRGIRRRLASMLNGDQKRLELAFSMMFSMPGTPVMYYGQEIGMGTDLSQKERNSVRTPMQWADAVNGGFSKAAEDQLIRSVIDEGPFGYQKINYNEQNRRDGSLLSWIEKIIRVRKQCPEIGYGVWEIIEVDNPQVIAHCCTWQGQTLVTLHNLSSEPVKLNMELRWAEGPLLDLLGNREYAAGEHGHHSFELDGYGYRWMRVMEQ